MYSDEFDSDSAGRQLYRHDINLAGRWQMLFRKIMDRYFDIFFALMTDSERDLRTHGALCFDSMKIQRLLSATISISLKSDIGSSFNDLVTGFRKIVRRQFFAPFPC